MDRKRTTLAALVILLLLALLYGWNQYPRQERVGTGAVKADRTPAAASGTSEEKKEKPVEAKGVSSLRRDLLASRPEPYPGVKQNLFRASTGGGERESAKPPAVVVPAEPVVVVPPVEVKPPPPPEPTPEQIVRRELARLVFLGFLKKEGSRTIFLASEGEIFLVHKGDRFGREKEFLVQSLTPTEMVVLQQDVGEIEIPLIDQAKLEPTNIREVQHETLSEKRSGAPMTNSTPQPIRGPLMRSRIPGGALPNSGVETNE